MLVHVVRLKPTHKSGVCESRFTNLFGSLAVKRSKAMNGEGISGSLLNHVAYTTGLFECSSCHSVLDRQMYTSAQWKNRLKRSAICITCAKKRFMFTCMGHCKRELGEDSFSSSQWRHRQDPLRITVCKNCSRPSDQVIVFKCRGECQKEFDEKEFAPSVWRHRLDSRRKPKCISCSKLAKKRTNTSVQEDLDNKKPRDSAASFLTSNKALASNLDDETGLHNLIFVALNDV